MPMGELETLSPIWKELVRLPRIIAAPAVPAELKLIDKGDPPGRVHLKFWEEVACDLSVGLTIPVIDPKASIEVGVIAEVGEGRHRPAKTDRRCLIGARWRRRRGR